MKEKLKIEQQEKTEPILETYRKYDPDRVTVSMIVKNMPHSITLSNGQSVIERKFNKTNKKEWEERKDYEESEKIRILNLISGSSNEEYGYRTFEIIRELKSENTSFGFINTKREYTNNGYIFTMTLSETAPAVVFSNKKNLISREFKITKDKVGTHDETDERHYFQENEIRSIIDQIFLIHGSKCDTHSIKISREYYKK